MRGTPQWITAVALVIVGGGCTGSPRSAGGGGAGMDGGGVGSTGRSGTGGAGGGAGTGVLADAGAAIDAATPFGSTVDAELDSGMIGTGPQKLTASDPAAGDYFGISVSISGETAVIGALYDDDNGSASGSVYVFASRGGAWTMQQKLAASDAVANQRFGTSVSISGDTIIVGASQQGEFGQTGPGSAYVFVRGGTTWTEQQRLTASDAAAGDLFGYSVSISGDTAVIGAHYDDDFGATSGSAYVFVRSGTTWTEQQKLTASDGAPFDWFGFSVSISGDTTIIGTPQDDDLGSNSGSAYVFVRSGTTWTEQQKLTASDAAGGDDFGASVSISGDAAIIGANLGNAKGLDSGAAYVFVRNGTPWTEQQKLTGSDVVAGDNFGIAVSASDDTVMVGATGYDPNETIPGSAYVFVRSGTTWTEQQKLAASDGAAGDSFGWSVSISGSTAIIGAPLDDDRAAGSGSAHIFHIRP